MRMGTYPVYYSDGTCIFFRSIFLKKDLTQEHAIPAALGGTYILKKASCRKCQSYINEKYEQITLQSTFLVPRMQLEFKRRKKNEPRPLPPVAIGANVDTMSSTLDELNVNLQPNEYPPSTVIPAFKAPGFVAGVDRPSHIEGTMEMVIVSLLTHPSYNANQFRTPENPTGKILMRIMTDHCALAMTYAKAAYSIAVGVYGLNGFNGNDLRDLLLGKRDDIFNFVGTIRENREIISINHIDQDKLHSFKCYRYNKYIIAMITLFSSFGAPPYDIVLSSE